MNAEVLELVRANGRLPKNADGPARTAGGLQGC
jgi:hypothetical protein